MLALFKDVGQLAEIISVMALETVPVDVWTDTVGLLVNRDILQTVKNRPVTEKLDIM